MKAGVGEFRDAVAAARSAGVSPGYVVECVAFYQVAAAADVYQQPGALYRRLRNAATFADPRDLSTWPARSDPPPRVARHLSEVLAWAKREGMAADDVRRVIVNKGRHDGLSNNEIKRALFEAEFSQPQTTECP